MILGTTGHRPHKLGGYHSAAYDLAKTFAMCVLEVCEPDKVITGMALGWDTAVARACVTLRIPFIAAIPCKGQDSMWQEADRARYRSLLGFAEEQIYVSPAYTPECMNKRNRWIVEHSDKMLAMYDGSRNGGTRNAVECAKSLSVPVTNVWSSWKVFKDTGVFRLDRGLNP